MEIHMPHAKSGRYLFKVYGTQYFLALNHCAGYHHIPLEEESIPQTAFTSPFGKYEYLKVPLSTNTGIFPRTDKVLKDLPFTIAYFDDIIIYSKTAKNLNNLQWVFHKCFDAKLTMKLSKYHFFTKEIKYLGHILSITGIKPLI